MNLSDRNRRALTIGVVAIVLMTGYWWFTREETPAVVSASIDSIPAAEKRLSQLKQIAGIVPGKELALAQVNAEMASRERNLIQADTAAQAQAQLLQIVRRVAKAPATSIDLRNTEIGSVKVYGTSYGEVAVSVNFEARIEQLVNLLADLTAQKELIGTSDMRLGAANPKLKTMPVRLTISGLVRRDLVPEKKGTGF